MPTITLTGDTGAELMSMIGALASARPGEGAQITAIADRISEQAARLDQMRRDQQQAKESIMATNQQVLSDLGSVKTALDKIGSETGGLLRKVSDLEGKLSNAGAVDPEVAAAVADLRAAVQRVDDMVPDVDTTQPGTGSGGTSPVDPAKPVDPASPGNGGSLGGGATEPGPATGGTDDTTA